VSTTLLATLGFIGGGLAMIVDGRRAVALAAIAVAAGLAPTVADVGGQPAAAVLIAAGLATLLVVPAADRLGRRGGGPGHLDPLVPVVSSGEPLFGPRSARVAAAAAAVPAASWVSFNVPASGLALTTGLLFAVAYAWLCGAARALLARTVEDLAVATAMVSLAGASGWILRGGSGSLVEAGLVAAIAPLSGIAAGWLRGRHSHLAALQ
jgi:hypothetical protein